MRYTVTRNLIQVIGTIWMPAVTCAQEYRLTDSDLENIGEPTRENVENWLCSHSGDFQSIQDFNFSFGAADWSGWENEDSECIYSDCMYGSEVD